MNVALVVVGDGRYAYQEQALASLTRFVDPATFCFWRVVDDSGGPSPLAFDGDWDVVRHPQRRGLAAAVNSAWADLPIEVDFVFHLEEDFVLTEPLEVDRMARTLFANPDLAQLVLKRQPWSAEERQAGGIIEMHPDQYTQRDGWVEHQRIFSLNPCLIPRHVVDLGWPASNEAGFTDQLVAAGRSFGFWGEAADPPRCLHIGAERSHGMGAVTAILGAGPHGREIADVARALGRTVEFYDDNPEIRSSGPIIRALRHDGLWVAGAAWPAVRRQIINQAEHMGIAQEGDVLIHPHSTIGGGTHLYGGIVVAAGARIGINVFAGAHTHIGMNATVSRDGRIGPCVTICPGAHLAGGVTVGEGAFIGIGAVVKHELTIGAGALIGAGAVVVEDVAPGAIVAGNPARSLR